MANKKPLKQHIQKDGTIWEWEETVELRKFIENQQKVKS